MGKVTNNFPKKTYFCLINLYAMKITIVSFAMVAAFGLISCDNTKHNTLTEQEKAEGWELLFDGETLDGWRDYNGTALTGPWEVVNGTIQADGQGSDASGYIVTDKAYENFELSWDWKISKGGNSGLLYHVVERPQFPVPYVTGPEYQLIDDINFAEPLEDWQRCGVDYAMYLPDFNTIKVHPAGEWNNSKIIFDNGHVTYFMNGHKTVEFDAWSDDWFSRKNSGKWANAPEYGLAHKGLICLQDHGYPAWFRNIKIKELPRKTREARLFNGEDITNWDKYGTELWYVKDGLLVCESGPDKQYGYLATREYYDDFDLTVEFKQEADGNSGVFIRSFVEEKDVKVNGWQVDDSLAQSDSNRLAVSWFDAMLNRTLGQIEEDFTEYRISEALMKLYRLFWDEFSGWYLEMVKPGYRQPTDRATMDATKAFFDRLLRTLHPFMPFITEEIWQHMAPRKDGESITVAALPAPQPFDQALLERIEQLKEAVSSVRNIRKEHNIPNKEALELYVIGDDNYHREYNPLLQKMANLNRVEEIAEKRSDAAAFIVKTTEYFVPLGGSIDVEEELKKLKADLAYQEGFLASVLKKLSNERFVQNAPAKVIETEHAKRHDAEAKIKALKERIDQLQ